MNTLDINYLKYFYYVIRCNGFTNAANELHVQQPVISRAIKLLEEQVGFKLIERQRKQVLLTPEGKEVFKRAEFVFSYVEQISNYSKEHKNKPESDFSFATSDSLSIEVMGPLLKIFLEKCPKLKPVHHAGAASSLIESIRSSEIEFGIFFNVPDLPSDLDASILGHVSFKFVVLKKLAKDQKILNSFIASREPSEIHAKRLKLFEKYKSRQKSALITSISSSAIARKAMVLNGLGVSVLPHFLVKKELEKGLLETLHNGDYSMPLYLVERKSSYRSNIKNDFLKLIKLFIEN